MRGVDGDDAGLPRRPVQQVRPEELLLPRPPQELPDLPVRPPALFRRLSRDRGARGPAARRHHPRPPRGGRGEAHPLRNARRGLVRGLQPGRRPAPRDRQRAGARLARGGVRVPEGPEALASVPRRLGLRHGEGEPPVRCECLDPPPRRLRARREGRGEEYELVPGGREGAGARDRAADAPRRCGRTGRAGDAPLGGRPRGDAPDAEQGGGPRLPLLPRSGSPRSSPAGVAALPRRGAARAPSRGATGSSPRTASPPTTRICSPRSAASRTTSRRRWRPGRLRRRRRTS